MGAQLNGHLILADLEDRELGDSEIKNLIGACTFASTGPLLKLSDVKSQIKAQTTDIGEKIIKTWNQVPIPKVA